MFDAEFPPAAPAAAEIRAVLDSGGPAAEIRGQLDLLFDQPLFTAAPPPPPPVWRAEDAPPDWPFVGLPPRAFRVIICDPPWRFRAYSDKGLRKSPQAHYACLRSVRA